MGKTFDLGFEITSLALACNTTTVSCYGLLGQHDLWVLLVMQSHLLRTKEVRRLQIGIEVSTERCNNR